VIYLKNRYSEGLARILPIVLIFTSIVSLLIGGVILGRWDYSVRGLIIAVPTIISSIILLYAFGNMVDDDEEIPIVFLNVNAAPYFLFILLYLMSVIVLLTSINRIMYLFVIAALYFTIFIQIVSQKISSNAIIIEIMLIMTNVIYGTTLVYPLFFRTTDVMIHNTLSTITFLSGHTIPVDLDVSYAFFPLFHIYNAVSSNIFGLSAQNTHSILTCLVYITVILFLYKIFKILSDNEQVSLLSCLCFSVIPTVLTRGIEMVASTAAFVGFVIFLYLVFASNETVLLTEMRIKSVIFKFLILLFAVYIILVHQVSIAQIVMLIFLFMACELILAETRYFSTSLMLFITVSFIAYWFFSAWSFAEQTIGSRIGLDYFDFGERHQIISDPSLSQMQVALMFLQNQLDMGIFLFFALIGIGCILYRQKPQYLSVVAMFSLLVMIFYVPNPLFTSQTISIMFRIDRFWILISPFMAFAMASGIFWLGKLSQKHARSYIFYSLIMFSFALFILLSLWNPILGITGTEGRLYFTDGELSGYEFVTEKISFGSELYSDYHTARFFHLDHFSLTDELELPYYRSNILSSLKISPQSNQYVIFRDSKFDDGCVIFRGRGGYITYVSNEENRREVIRFYNLNNKIYNNNYISIIFSKL